MIKYGKGRKVRLPDSIRHRARSGLHLHRLEDRLAPQGRKPFLIVVTDAAQKLALDSGRCVQILREAGHVDSTSRLVDLGNIPDGLNAAELERYLREYGVGRRSA